MSMGMAYAMKKRSKKMAKGGQMCASGGFIEEENASGMEAMPVEHEKQNEAAMHEDADMIARIMHKRKEYSEGGQVANDIGTGQDADALPNQFDDLVLRDDDMEDADYTGADSGDEIGDHAQDERDKDVVHRIMKSRSKKDRMPRPA